METTQATGSLSLIKGQKIDVTKTNPDLTKVGVGLGWKENVGNGSKFDLDASCIMLSNGKVWKSPAEATVYFNHLTAQGVQHNGDNRTGVGEGDDEIINVNLPALAPEVDALIFVINMFECVQRRQNFGMVRDAYVRIYNDETKVEIAKYDLSEDATSGTALTFAKLYKHNNEWKFEALGEVTNATSLTELVDKYSL